MTDERDEERDEEWWSAGYNAAWLSMLQRCLSELGHDDRGARAVLELERARVSALDLCERLGVECPRDLNLADVIEKRIGRQVLG